MRKVIISLAPVQAGTSVDAVKLAEDVEKSVKLGAAMCHLHCRKPDGSPGISGLPFFYATYYKNRPQRSCISIIFCDLTF